MASWTIRVGVGSLLIVSGVLACVAAAPALAQGHPEERLNTRLVGTDDLQGRSAYHPLPVEQGGRRILYVGHHAGEALNPLTGRVEVNGTSIVEVTDPARPVYLHHIPATGDAQGAQMVQVCSGADLPGADPGETYLLRANGNQSHEVWDVSDPADPAFVTTVATMGHTPDGQQNTHKNWWECDTGIAYLIGTVDGWRAPRVVQVFDLSNPSTPRRIRDFSLDGVQPDASGPVPGGSGVHEVVPLGERLYLSYGTSRNGVLQIVDRERLLRGDPRAAGPLESSPSGLRFPQIGRLDLPFFWGGHTAFPLVDVPIGLDNSIAPGSPDQGQPTHFLPRRSRFVFAIRVPADFGTKELVWTLTSNGQTERAYATLKRDYFLDKLVIQANFGAGGPGGTTPELPDNEAPTLALEGDRLRTAGVGQPLMLAAIVRDDGKPKARRLPPTNPRRPGRITTDTATGLRLSWFVYRGAGQVTFDPPQITAWEDTRVGGNSPWSPGWSTPEPPTDNRWEVAATFGRPGTYILRALAHDGGLSTYEDVTVTVGR